MYARQKGSFLKVRILLSGKRLLDDASRNIGSSLRHLLHLRSLQADHLAIGHHVRRRSFAPATMLLPSAPLAIGDVS